MDARKFCEDISSFLNSENLCDFILKCQGIDFRVHKVILSGRSDYFAALFRNDMRESAQGFVEIEGVDPAVLREVLRHIYGQELTDTSTDAVGRIYVVAERFAVTSLQAKCVSLILENFTMSSKNVSEDKTQESRKSEIKDSTDAKQKLLKELFLTAEWKNIEEFPALAEEMCKSIILTQL